MRKLEMSRVTRETEITAAITWPDRFPGTPGGAGDGAIVVRTGVPFFDHMLQSFCFHGGFGAEIAASGDTEVDDHHTVEDVGIVMGQLFSRVTEEFGPVRRFGHALVPMDDALGEVVVDAGGRSYLVYQAVFPQPYAGKFDLALVREFFTGFSGQARANVHVLGRYGANGHHLAEAIFKAAGRALAQAYLPAEGVQSTKGVL